jgi:CDP-glycerol glycerophosphotransferase (TagB/SpsB family)
LNRYLLYAGEIYAFSILRPLQAAIRARGDEAAWFLEDRGRLARFLKPEETLLRSVRAVKEFRPRAVFVPGNQVPGFFPGVKVELFHGFNARKRPDHRGHFRVRNFFDLYCTQGPDTTKPFRVLEVESGFFEVAETGWPKMDPLFQEEVPPGIIERGRPVVLLTSTFTPKLSAAPHILEPVKRLAAAGRWRWLVNFHPKMDPAVVEAYRGIQGENLSYVDTEDIIPLLKSADVMVSDTSSVVSEFLLQLRPVVTFRNRRPGPHLIDINEPEELEKAVETALSPPPELAERIREYADWIHPYRDGRSSRRVLAAADDLCERGLGHLRKKPLNILRRLKMRRRLGYYLP